MTRHSKNNTSSGAFSYAERQKLSQYGTQAVRCTAENLRPSTHCHLCLQEAKQPNCCTQGHLACRECFLQDILAQKEAFKRAEAEAAAEAKRLQSEAEAKAKSEKEAQVKDFLEQQQAGAKRAKLSSELAHVTDSSTTQQPLLLKTSSTSAKAKAEISCRGGGKEAKHSLSLKTLIPVQMPASGACPSCSRPLKTIPRFLVAKNCGHVACAACHEKMKVKHCFTCSAAIEETLTVCAEGTGFAAGGGTTQTSRYELGFQ